MNSVFTPTRAGAPGIAAMTASARRSVAADGATVVLRESDCAHYIGEDAISALWKGQAFPRPRSCAAC